jgi:hypothetical protein
MRRSPLWLLATLLAVGCDQPAEPNLTTTAGSPAFAQDPAERTVVDWIGGVDQRFEECLGEQIRIEWTNRLKIFERRDATGNLHFRLGLNEVQSTVTGLTSGTVWRSVGAENFSLNGDDSSAEAPGELTHVNTINFVGTAGAPTLKILIRDHITINGNEIVTVERSEVTVFCG